MTRSAAYPGGSSRRRQIASATAPPEPASHVALRVLLVQGDAAAARDILSALREADVDGVEVHHVRGFPEAVARLGAAETDVILVDLALTDASGSGGVRVFRSAAPAVAVVGLAHEDDPILSRRAVHDGAEDVLVTPIADGGRMIRALRHAVERHRIHASLRLQAEQQGAIVEGSIQGIVIQQDGILRYANRSIARLMGYESAAEIIGMSSLDHIAPHERERILEMGKARLRGESVPDRYEFQLRRRDGTYVMVDCMVTPVIWEGRPAIVGTMLDVTEQRRNEAATRALAEIGRELVGTVGLEAVTRMIVTRVQELFGAGFVRLYRLGPRPGHLTCVAAAGGRTPETWIGWEIPVGEGVTGRAVAEARPIWSADVHTDRGITIPETFRRFIQEEGFRSGVAVPLMVGGQPKGGLFLGDPPGHTFGADDISLLTAFADRAALAVDKAALYERAATRAENLAVLAQVSGVIAAATGNAGVFEAVARAAITLFGAAAAGVLVDDPAAGLLRVGPHFRPDSAPWVPGGIREVPYTRGVAGAVYQSREPAFIEDIQADPRWIDKRAAQEAGLHGYAGLPLIARDRAIGVLSIFFGERRPFTTEERELMGLLAVQGAIAMDNARLLQETERRRRAAEALADVARLIAPTLDPTEVAGRITASVQRLLGVTNAALFRFRPATNDLESLSLVGDHGPTGGKAIVYPVGSGAVGLAVRERRTVVTPDLLSDPRIVQPAEQRERMERAPFRAVLAVPLLVQARVVGALVLGDPAGRRFTEEEVQIAEAFADRAAIALETARLYAEVRDGRDFLQSIAESSADAIVTTDGGARINYWSAGAREIFGYGDDEVLGQLVKMLYMGGGEEMRSMHERLEAEGSVRDYEAALRTKTGRPVTGAVSLARLRDVRGEITGTVAVIKDVTERRLLEDSLRQSQKMEAVGRLAGGIAHDFNNLMTVIIGRSQLILYRMRPEDPLRRDIELFGKTAERAARLTAQLLAFSRQQVLQPKVLDLDAVVTNMGSLLRRLIGEDIELRTISVPGLWRVKADPGQIEQVIVNLAVNARDAMSRGGQLTIETANAPLDEAYARLHTAVRPGPHVMLAVSDTGTGMDEATRARIFEPFFTTKEPGKGTGLGLATVYGIVKQSGGNIWVYSELGRGTTFKLYLPVAEGAGEGEPAEPPPERPVGGSETILVVEDEESLREVVRESLQVFGYTLLEARHGGEALLIAERHAGPIHLLLTDVVMPTMNGAELARRLAPLRPEMDVLYVSGYTDEAIVHHGVLEPGMAFLQKPFSPDQIVRKVREVLDARRR